MPEELASQTASAPEHGRTSESEEMYLITVARAAEDGRDGPVPLARIAASLDVSVASANQMVRKLADRGLLTYVPYRGVELSGDGVRVAARVLRTRRLWATFLAEHLGFSPSDADDQACHLEHATSPEAADRLAEYLGHPAAGPLGHPIPPGQDLPPRRGQVPLSEFGAGAVVEVVAISGAEGARAFLAAEGIGPGAELRVIGTGASGVLVEVGGAAVHVAPDLASAIAVVPREMR